MSLDDIYRPYGPYGEPKSKKEAICDLVDENEALKAEVERLKQEMDMVYEDGFEDGYNEGIRDGVSKERER